MVRKAGSIPDIVLTRSVAAPPAEVYAAWTEPERMGWMFNPDSPVERPPTVDLRVGGQWLLRMVIDSSTSYVTGGLYTELVPGKVIGFRWGALDGWPLLALEAPEESPMARLTLAPEGPGTRVRLVVEVPADYLAQRGGMEVGWAQALDRLVSEFGS